MFAHVLKTFKLNVNMRTYVCRRVPASVQLLNSKNGTTPIEKQLETAREGDWLQIWKLRKKKSSAQQAHKERERERKQAAD